MKPLDLSKPLQTRRGEKAELVYDRLTGDYPLAVIVHFDDGTNDVLTYTREGNLYTDADSSSNLVNVPVQRTLWLNIYKSGGEILPHPSRERADLSASDDRIACIEVTYTEGEGL